MTAQPQAPGAFPAEEVLEAENFIETYQIIGEWIRFADAKAAVTLTVNGVLLGLLVPTLKTYLTDPTPHPTTWWPGLVVGLFVGWVVLLVISAIFAFLCILPLRGPSRQLAFDQTKHFHPAAVARAYSLADREPLHRRLRPHRHGGLQARGPGRHLDRFAPVQRQVWLRHPGHLVPGRQRGVRQPVLARDSVLIRSRDEAAAHDRATI